MSTARALPAPRLDDDIVPEHHDRRFVLWNVSWKQYLALRRMFDDRSGLRMTYLEGALELMSPSEDHEALKTMTARLMEAYAEEVDLPLNGLGSATFRKKAKERGVEPDECYFVLPRKRKFPDLVVEVIITSGGIDRLAVYEGLQVPEVWLWLKGRYHVYQLGPRGYVAVPRSKFLPGLDLALVHRFVRREDQTAAVKEFRSVVRARLAR